MIEYKSIEDIELKLNSNVELKGNIEQLVNIYLKDKLLKFDKINSDINISILEKENILTKTDLNYEINEDILFSYLFYIEYSKKKSFSLNEHFKESIGFLKNISKEFKGVRGYNKIKRLLLFIVILESNNKYETNFLDYVNNLEKEKDAIEIRSFINSFGNTIPFLNISISDLCNIIEKLSELSGNESLIGFISKGIRDKVFNDEKYGNDLFDYIIKKTKFEHNILGSVISGIFDKKGIAFFNEKIKAIIGNKKYSIPIIIGLSSIQNIDEDNAKLFLNIIKSLYKSDEEILEKIPIFLSSIIRSESISNKSQIKQNCFNEFISLINIDNTNVRNSILYQLDFIESFEKDRYSLIVELIRQDNFNEDEHLHLIDNIVHQLNDIKYFEETISILASKNRYIEISKKLHNSIYKYQHNNTLKYEKIIIHFLIHNSPYFRHFGHDLFINLSNPVSEKYFKFSFDILKLDNLSQYKLWVSICQDFREPKDIIPCLLPLLKSKSNFVKEIFVYKLKELSVNYKGALIKVLKDNLEPGIKNNIAIINEIKKYQDNYFDANIKPKEGVEELNPYYSQYGIFNDYMKKHQRDFSRNFNRGLKENNGFLSSMMTNITLAKGGGWKHSEKDKITPLVETKTSFSLPRDYFLEPEFFDFEISIEKGLSWDDKFNWVKRNLRNESNDK